METERSFSARAKDEMCKKLPQRDCCAQAELYGVLLFSRVFSKREIRMVTEHEKFAERLTALCRRVCGVTPASSVSERTGKYTVEAAGSAAERLFSHFGHEEGLSPAIHLNNALVEEDHCRDAFIRGMFLAAGSVSDPEKNYHLELVTRHFNLSREVIALLLDMELRPKTTLRKSNYIIYFKDSAEIEDFLTRAGAPVSAIRVMETKIEKDVRNQANRKFNCDNANITKTVDAAQRQLAAIRTLEQRGRLMELSDSLRGAAELRREHPDAALSELAEIAGVSRSGLNHRLNRLCELANET